MGGRARSGVLHVYAPEHATRRAQPTMPASRLLIVLSCCLSVARGPHFGRRRRPSCQEFWQCADIQITAAGEFYVSLCVARAVGAETHHGLWDSNSTEEGYVVRKTPLRTAGASSSSLAYRKLHRARVDKPPPSHCSCFPSLPRPFTPSRRFRKCMLSWTPVQPSAPAPPPVIGVGRLPLFCRSKFQPRIARG